MTKLSPLPVKGYQSQTPEAVDIVNRLKEDVERLKRQAEEWRSSVSTEQQGRDFSIAITKLEEFEFRFVRGVFAPDRITLPEDEVKDG